jgi:hypothetical protein
MGVAFLFNDLSGIIMFGAYTLFAFYISLIAIIYLKKDIVLQIFRKTLKYIYILIFIILAFFPLAYLALVNNEIYGFYYSTNDFLTMLNYLDGMAFTIVIIIIFTQFEFSISDNQRNQLKDNYSHDLGNLIQIIHGATYLVKEQIKDQRLSENNVEKIELNLGKTSDLIKKIRNL